jgi:FkbM family methyltransferase
MIKNKLKNIINYFLVGLKTFFNIKILHSYNNFFINLPAYHRLPDYQRSHPKYDRFLPHLIKNIEVNSCVIDVGANCGDTLAGMADKNATLQYICIEPDQNFYALLLSNIENIKVAYPDFNVVCKKYLVGKSFTNVSLDGVGGTKHAVVGSGTLVAKPLDEILDEITVAPVRLLKSDVDGFDYDVIDSARELLTSQHPMIFFECQNNFDYQKRGFEETIIWLQSIGYTDWVLFDNFGEVVLRSDRIDQIFQLLEYVWSQNKKLATRTIFYFDILSATPKDKDFVDAALKSY